MIPEFTIVGVEKSATTSLHFILRDHPQVFMYEKELHFFNNNWDRGVDWYKSTFADAPDGVLRGDKSPAYCVHPEAPKRMRQLNPDVKLIWLFRQPSERAYSQFWFEKVRENVHALPDDLDKPLGREQISIRDRSMYGPMVRRYLHYFSKNQMLFMLSEHFSRDPDGFVKTVCEFLEVEPIVPERTVWNTTYNPNWIWLNKLARDLGINKWPLAYRIAKKLGVRQKGGYPPMSQELRADLDGYYRESNEELAALTGLDLSVWEHKSG